jgi:fission process protein 1
MPWLAACLLIAWLLADPADRGNARGGGRRRRGVRGAMMLQSAVRLLLRRAAPCIHDAQRTQEVLGAPTAAGSCAAAVMAVAAAVCSSTGAGCSSSSSSSVAPPRRIGQADLTGDGRAETTIFDTVGDGRADALDTTGDGEVDTVLVDLYRDTPLRYMGYANEVGEAFRPIVPRLVVPSYAVAIAYVLADTQDKGRAAYQRSVKASSTGEPDTMLVAEQAGDCLVWQLLASVFVPGFVIHQVVHAIGWALKRAASVPVPVRTWLPTIGGLAAIPFIIHPIDHAVDVVLDNSIRKIYRSPVHADPSGTVLGTLDLTGDGTQETTAYDTTGDGKVDALDTTGDGRIDHVLRPANVKK